MNTGKTHLKRIYAKLEVSSRAETVERDIGRELFVSHNTVHSHVRSIYRKLGVPSRAHALVRTRELSLL